MFDLVCSILGKRKEKRIGVIPCTEKKLSVRGKKSAGYTSGGQYRQVLH
jgi:hypothetical protein